ncbi:MAG: magnesium transporter [Nanoarchaeota archaeon]|nr:magnesium transporter [Nanoarchaeota archaeon]
MEESKDSIIHKIITEVPIAKKKDTIGSVLNKINKDIKKLKEIDYVYVIEEQDKLVGVFSIKELFAHKKQILVEKIMKTNLITISPEANQEKAAELALKHHLKHIPVVKNGKLLGVVPSNKILSILNHSLQEDILHFAGIHKSHLKYENTMAAPLQASIFHRIPWLIIGLIGILFIAAFINLFAATLEKYIILAFFIPAIVYMSDALGTQNQMLFIRDLAILGKELKIGYYFLRQMFISFFLSLIISAVVFGIVSLFWNQVFVAFVISFSIFIALIFSSFTALLTTLIINKLGKDPALGSGPFATIISDTTSVILYFLIAVWLL